MKQDQVKSEFFHVCESLTGSYGSEGAGCYEGCESVPLKMVWKQRARISTLENLYFLGDGTTLNYMKYERWD